jgi:hypothetical protein
MKRDAATGFGGLLLLTGLIGLACAALPASRRGLRRTVKHPEQATVIITPLGIAMMQGDTRGEVAWNEIKHVNLRTKPPGFAITGSGLTTGVELALGGAMVRIVDIYDRSQQEIYERIMANWR